jgi:hypothetical protein
MGEHGQYRALVKAFTCALLLALTAAPAMAACRIALVLALDVSASVSGSEHRLQREGLASALEDSAVRQAFLADPAAPVTLLIFEWSGRYQQDVLLDWTAIEAPADLADAAAILRTIPRGHNDAPTAIGYALGFAAGLFGRGPECDIRKIDVSGDGRNNEGFRPVQAYKAFPLADVIVNGLAISGQDDGLAEYYRTDMIKGPGAFVEVAHGFDDFARAMRRKLLRELEGPVIGMSGPGPAG